MTVSTKVIWPGGGAARGVDSAPGAVAIRAAVSGPPIEEKMQSAVISSPLSRTRADRPAAARQDAAHPALHPPLAAGPPVFFEQQPEQRPDALERPGQPLQQDGPEKEREDAEVHVVFRRPAVHQHRAKEHVGEYGIAHIFTQDRPGREIRAVGRIDRLPDALGEPAKAVDLRREDPGHLGLEEREIVREAERRLAPGPEGDPRPLLLAELELLAADPQLPQERPERRPLDAGPDEIGHRMQPDVELPAGDAVEAVQPAHGVVPLEDAHPLAEVGQPDASRQPGKPRPNDRNVVVRPGVQRFAARALNFGRRYSAELSSEAMRP